ncbi:MAG: hypoxanthine/guanine phosphoribosyltransferase [Halobacteria archaeon]|nr:hypoxanthine/guanine phosphoribosyltransferase [Halobacteria archaeon]
MERLRESLLNAPVVSKGDYDYFVHPITDGIPLLEPSLLREIVTGILRKSEVEKADKIVAPEAMGIHISTAVSLATDVPVVVVRKRGYGLEGETQVRQTTGYSENEMYINNVNEGDTVVLLDDVVSTGGTLSSIVGALEDIGADVADVVTVIQKRSDERELDTKFKSLIEVDVVDGEVEILSDTTDTDS